MARGPTPFHLKFWGSCLLWRVPTSQRASEDKTEIACLQAIVIARQSLHVAQRQGQWHRKALRGHEQGRTIAQAQIQAVRVRVRFRLEHAIVEAQMPMKMILKLVGVDTHGLTPVALAKEVVIYIEDCMPSNSL